LRDTPIVILDEPTAALDPKTENRLMAGLKQVADEKLFIIIAHRLSTVKAADQIIFIEDGKISDVGSHNELMSKKTGRYRQFVNLQNN
jgi:ABC-type multidrug transport system fused ATPase/permease subunit